MKNIYLLALSHFISSGLAFADGPFGEVDPSVVLRGGDQSGCAASAVVSRVVSASGVNIVTGQVASTWSCGGVTSRTAEARRCPYPQYAPGVDGSDIRCFSNTESGGMTVCVSGASSVVVQSQYTDARSPRNERYLRFQHLWVIKTDMTGQRVNDFYHMDVAGCQVQEARINDVLSGDHVVIYQECASLFQRMLTGGLIEPENIRRRDHFCHQASSAEDRYSYAGAYQHSVEQLGHCFDAIPNFSQRFRAQYGYQREGSRATSQSVTPVVAQ